MMTDIQLESLLGEPKKIERYIQNELMAEIQRRMNDFIIDRLFIQMNQE